MASHNGLSNGVNGTVETEVVEHSTTMEVKSIQSVSITSIQEVVTQPGFDESPIQLAVHQPGFISTDEFIDIQKSGISSEIVHTEAAEVNQPTIQQPAVSLPVVDQPVVEQLLVEEPVIDLPAVVQPAVEVPAVDQPAVEIPELVQPAVEVPAVEVPAVEIPEVQLLSVEQPVFVPASQGTDITSDVSLQPQVITEEPVFTREVKEVKEVTEPAVEAKLVVEIPVVEIAATKLPGNMPGSSDFHVPQYAIDALYQIAQSEGFTNYVVDYERGSNFGDGFVAEIVRATINGSQTKKGVQEESELVVVLKLPPENKTRRETMGMNVFEREVTAYNEIIPMFQKFQLDRGLKPGQGFVSFPKCYYASYDKEKDEAVIIMEDIRKKGFKMQNKYRPVDFAHAKAVLETVAQLHGLSLAIKDQCPAVFDKFKGLNDMLVDGMKNDMMKQMTALNCEKAVETLEPHEEKIKQKLRAFCDNMMDIVQSCTNGELSEPYSVINHGDCWINNMMFKYQSGFPSQLCLLDWQIVRYASPVLDVVYFLYLCTDSALRAQHFDSLIQGYHIALRKQVELLGSDVNQILPFTALLRELKNKAKYALSTALFIIPMLCTPNAELPNLDDLVESLSKGELSEDNQMFNMTSNTESIYKKRMSGIIRDMYKKGYM